MVAMPWGVFAIVMIVVGWGNWALLPYFTLLFPICSPAGLVMYGVCRLGFWGNGYLAVECGWRYYALLTVFLLAVRRASKFRWLFILSSLSILLNLGGCVIMGALGNK